MKQNNYKPLHHQKLHYNNPTKTQNISGCQSQQKQFVQELKTLNHEEQFLLKKQDWQIIQKTKESLNERKIQSQVNKREDYQQLSEKIKNNSMLSQKISSSEQINQKQQIEHMRKMEKVKKADKAQNSVKNKPSSILDDIQEFTEKQIEKRSKKQLKQLKRIEKQKQNIGSVSNYHSNSQPNKKRQQMDSISSELLQIFRQKYSFYLIDNKLVYPIQDNLFELYPQLTPQRIGQHIPHEKIMKKLPESFSKQLQIWNMLIEHSSFFQIDQQITVQDIQKMLLDQDLTSYKKLFKNLHKFYIQDIIIQKYDESSNEDYFSFISLWKYAQENSFQDKLFHTSWNKFILFYISLQKNNYNNKVILEEFSKFQAIINENIEKGIFDPPSNYNHLLDYLIFLINMCFQTSTFKTLINNKMLFFRDNNKFKNQLLQDKKNIEGQLWQLKENQKQVIKKQKLIIKQIKKQQKQHGNDRIQSLERESMQIDLQKRKLAQRRESLQQNVIEIDNKIYQLCCLPQFSNVWLLGEDCQKNLYWFIRQQQNAIYCEDKNSGEWNIIQYQNISLFHRQLNIRGIRQRKLYEKILYYKQLGYIKTSKQISANGNSQSQMVQQTIQRHQNNAQNDSAIQVQQDNNKYVYDVAQFDKFSYSQYKIMSPQIIKLMILKSQWMMSKYLYQRNSKWILQESRQQYINKMVNHDLRDYENLTQELRTFNQKICVVEINIKIANQNDGVELKTRKIQTKIWGINEKYKHFWYDYSRKCKSLSDLHFLVSILYLTIEKYVTKTRKPNNTKYFFKTVQFGENNQGHDNFNEDDLLLN